MGKASEDTKPPEKRFGWWRPICGFPHGHCLHQSVVDEMHAQTEAFLAAEAKKKQQAVEAAKKNQGAQTPCDNK